MSKSSYVIRQLVNGVFTSQISVLDRGLHYGDGLFETMLVKNGNIQNQSEHFQRLQAGCDRLNISAPSIDTFNSECGLLLGEVDVGVIKVIVSRGEAVRGYGYDLGQASNRILILYPPVSYALQNWTAGIKLHLCQTRLGCNPQLAGIKHLNRLEQVMARSEWVNPAISEGLMLDVAGNVIEGTMSNVFLVENSQLVTADLRDCGVAGIQRQKIIDCAKKLQIPVRIEIIPLHRLLCADEVFISNSIIGIWPVSAIAEQGFELGSITSKLMNTLKVLPSE